MSLKQAILKRCLTGKLRLYSGVCDRSVRVHYTVQCKPCVSVVCTKEKKIFAFYKTTLHFYAFMLNPMLRV